MKLLLLFFAFFSLSNAAQEVSKSAEDAAKEAHLANINALLIFTSQDGLNTGLFHFTKVDVDMQIYNLPFLYHFESEKNFNYFIVGNVGYSNVFTKNEFVFAPEVILNSDSHLQTYTGGIGLGVRYKLRDYLSISSGAEFIYSRSGVSTKHLDGGITAPIEDFFKSKFNDNVSYKLFAEFCYSPKLQHLNPYIKLGYNFFDTKSDMDLKTLSTFSTQSSLSTFTLGATSEPFAKREYGYLVFEPYAHLNYLQGDVVNSIRFDTYSKVGGVLYMYHKNSPSWIERYFFEASTINADGLEGYNLGLGFSIEY